MPTPIIDALKDDSDLTMHTHTEADLGATLDNRYVNVTGDTMTGNLILNDNVSVLLGTGSDGELFHDGTNTYFQNNTGDIIIENDASDGDITFKVNDGGVDKTVMTLDGATGNVGIGTTSTSTKLHINTADVPATTGQEILRLDSNISWGTIGSGPKILFHYNIGNADLAAIRGYTFGNSDTGIAFDTGYNSLSTKMVINNAGNVGIGTTSPVTKLDLSYNSAIVSIGARFVNTATSGSTSGAGMVGLSDDGAAMASGDRLGYFLLGGSYDNSHTLTNTAGMSGFATEAWSATNKGTRLAFEGTPTGSATRAEWMTIKDGNVGIGTTSPVRKLQVVVNDAVTNPFGSGGYQALSVQNTNTTDNNWVALSFAGQDTGGTYASAAFFAAQITDHTPGSMDADFTIWTNQAGTIGERMRITNNGNVGIGTTSPGAKLHINDATSNPALWLTGGTITQPFTSVGFVPEVTANTSASWTQRHVTNGGAQLNAFTANGNSGVIGFEFNGHIGSASPNDGASAIVLAGWKSNGGTSRSAMSGTNKVLQIRAGTSNLVTVQGNGNVGIGTTSPSAILHVEGAISTSNNLFMMTDNTASGGYFKITDNTSIAGHFNPTLWSKGVGTSSADRIGLTIIGEPGEDGTDDAGIELQGRLNGAVLVNAPVLRVKNYATELMRVSASGNVGIGTTSPSGRLHINGTADDQQLIVEAHSTQTNNIVEIHDSSSNVLISFNGVGGAVFNEQGSATADFRVESDTEANMLFVDANANTDGSVYLGGTTNGIEIKKGGDLTLLGTAKYERHVQIPAMANGLPANQPAEVDFFTAGGLQFASAGAQYAYCQWEIPDDWDGTDVVFEVDWFPDSGAISGTDTIKWDVEYRSIAEGEAINNGTSVTVSVTDSTDYAQYITKHSRFTLTYNNANQPLVNQDHIYFKISRDTSVANDFAGTVTVAAYEIIYQSKGFPSSN